MTHTEAQKLRDLTASQMTCDCGEPLAITAQGVICPGAKCIGRYSRSITVPHSTGHRRVLSKSKLARAWPERVVEHDRPFRARLAEFSEGLKGIET